MNQVRVLVTGAAGRMGQAVMQGVLEDPECTLVGAVDVCCTGTDAGTILGMDKIGVSVEEDLSRTIRESVPDVMVDFTLPEVAQFNIKTALEMGVYPVVGTTGLSEQSMEEIFSICESGNLGAFFAPNFAIGAVLMMQYAKNAAKFLPNVEIVELHHDQKKDAPSGTALRTVELIAQSRGEYIKNSSGFEKIKGSRGGEYEGIHIHSIRLPGFVAHQEVIFGGLGQTLSIRHDSISRESFIPGVLLAVKEAPKRQGVIVGLENLLGV